MLGLMYWCMKHTASFVYITADGCVFRERWEVATVSNLIPPALENLVSLGRVF